MDDRACFCVLLRTLELLRDKELDVELVVLGSTREEVNGSGQGWGILVFPRLLRRGGRYPRKDPRRFQRTGL
jgi:hypothetical protein